jgi:hypothetical protein
LDVRLLLLVQRVEHPQLNVAAALGGIRLLFASGVGCAGAYDRCSAGRDRDPGHCSTRSVTCDHRFLRTTSDTLAFPTESRAAMSFCFMPEAERLRICRTMSSESFALL